MKPNYFFYIVLACYWGSQTLSVYAQKSKDKWQTPAPSTTAEIENTAQAHATLKKQTLLPQYPVRSVGPNVMGGRVVDIEVNPHKPKQFYVAFASGGVFRTDNNGQSFTPIFDHQPKLIIGDIAIGYNNPEVLWVGTGENNSSRSSYAGMGVYQSKNGGKTWVYSGLPHLQHTSRIVIHPQNTDIVWVASIGNLYTKNKERGIFKTTDGGRTWKHVLFVNDSTGVIDLVINPKNPQQLWACSWERSRKAWDFKENGIGSAVYRSDDGGETWQKMMKGLPESTHLGRMGIATCLQKPSTLYLIVDNQQKVPKNKEKNQTEAQVPNSLQNKDLEKMNQATFLALPDSTLDAYLKQQRFPAKYTPQKLKEDVKQGKYAPQAIAQYNQTATEALFETEVRGAEVYKSEDAGDTWQKTHDKPLEDMFFTYGYYFGQIRINPNYANQIYVLGVTLQRSDDGGKTFKKLQEDKIHADHHALWINPLDSDHILLGNDGGMYQSYDAGDNFIHLNSPSVGQFYSVAIDFEKPYNIYGGLQDNGTYFGSSTSVPNQSKDWESLGGGDGMMVQVNPQNANECYVGYQFGNYFRIEKFPRKRKFISPKHDIGEAPLRFNWRTPLLLSKHSPSILYIASNKLHLSLDKGDTWQTISPDLTQNRPQGDVPFSTISALVESPLKFGLLYVGTDDGKVWLTQNNGHSWQDISQGLPPNRWVAHLHASPHHEGTIFVVLNGYRFDEFKTYIFQSTDFGKTWVSLKNNLPDEVCNVLVQDLLKPQILYLGTDYGLYVSTEAGKNWQAMGNDLPNVPIYDLVQHPREQELVIGTHGRSIYVLDCKPLQQWDNTLPLQAFQPPPVAVGKSINLLVYVQSNIQKIITISLNSSKNTKEMLFSQDFEVQKGFNQLKIMPPSTQENSLKAGKYTISIRQDKQTITIPCVLR